MPVLRNPVCFNKTVLQVDLDVVFCLKFSRILTILSSSGYCAGQKE